MVKMQQKRVRRRGMFGYNFSKKGLTNYEYRCIIMHIIQVQDTLHSNPKEKYHEKDYCYYVGSDAGSDRYRHFHRL